MCCIMSYRLNRPVPNAKHLPCELWILIDVGKSALTFAICCFRLTPVYAAMIVFGASWLIHMGEGPMWNIVVGTEVDNCRRHWWINLLYFNNYFEVEEMVSFQLLAVHQQEPPICTCKVVVLLLLLLLLLLFFLLLLLFFFFSSSFSSPSPP